jgi:hypothetical protein
MNERDDQVFEAELQRLVPAQPPARLMARLTAALPQPSPLHPQPSTLNPEPPWRLLFRWLAPAAAAATLVAALLFWLAKVPLGAPHDKPVTVARQAAPKADAVEIDRQLVALFDAVAQLPNGQPVRFRCREWTDEVVFRDPARGLVIESRTPRLEVVPVRFETY